MQNDVLIFRVSAVRWVERDCRVSDLTEEETLLLLKPWADRIAALQSERDALKQRVAELEGDLLYIGSKWPTGLYTDHFKYDNGVTRLIVWLNEKEVEEIKRIAAKEPTP